MDNNDGEQRAALGIVWAIVGVVVVAMLLLAGYFGVTAGKGADKPAATVAAPATAASGVAAGAETAVVGVPAVVKILFETGKSEVPASAATDLGPVEMYLKANPAATAAVSGFHDASGNADVNAEVSKDRAKAVRAVLVAAGVEEARVTLDKPQVSLAGDDAGARRVEVTVHQ
ncbi:Cytochrome c oxidase polypeptide II [Collimonas arenae]|uniref:Cytochrome c oxidase polypeptide II n=1 Tax=Collimonas arenae TaxID=279058 RepID=A0A0A1FCI3_9BURK|nr:OmpA family protein [Collimonas arenae]AIY42463.1 Cytochrome c oxidase polypeptide II [Collimonas arenae]